MSRERDRIAKRREKNPVAECNKIQKKFYPELFSKFSQITDSRHLSYTHYSSKVMLGSLYYKGIAGSSSMQGMTREFNDEAVVRLAAKIKKRFPRLPICIVADGLYVSEKVLEICRENKIYITICQGIVSMYF